MPTPPNRPIIFISYAHADEPEKPADGEIKWLSFVTGYLRPAEKEGAVEVWTDRLMHGGDDWSPEIESNLRACDIFVLLVSPNSTGSDYIVDKEMAIIRERQASGEYVHFYPLLLTPTPKSGLDMVRDKNLRPRDGKPFSSYSFGDRQQQMSDAADEIVRIAAEIAARKTSSPLGLASLSSVPSPPGEEKQAGLEPEIRDRQISGTVATGARAIDGGIFARFSGALNLRTFAGGAAALVVVFGIAIWAFPFVRDLVALRDCDLTALMTWKPTETAVSPLYVELAAGDLSQFAVGNGIPVALTVPAAHTRAWKLTVVWSDRTRSQFGKLSECYKTYSEVSDDKRVLLSLESR